MKKNSQKFANKEKKISKHGFIEKFKNMFFAVKKFYKNLENFEKSFFNVKEEGDFKREDFQRLIDSQKLDVFSLLRGAATIVHKKFFSFVRVNLLLTVGFLMILLAIFLQWGVKIPGISYDFVQRLTFVKIIGLDSIFPLVILLFFWIFFSYLRSSYLAVAGNYFTHSSLNPITVGFRKILSFMLVEALQIVVFLIGLFSVMLLPAFSTRYFIASAAMINQNQGGVNAMLESKEYTNGKMCMMLGFMFFITIFTTATVLSCLAITNLFIDNRLIFWATNFFLFTFLFLPLHSCYRLLLYKKLRHSRAEFRIKISLPQKLWFIASRIIVLTLLVINIFLIANGAFGDVFDKIVFSAQNACEVIFRLQMNWVSFSKISFWRF